MYKDNFEIVILRKWEICSFDLWEILSSIFFVVKHVEKEEEDKKWRRGDKVCFLIKNVRAASAEKCIVLEKWARARS